MKNYIKSLILLPLALVSMGLVSCNEGNQEQADSILRQCLILDKKKIRLMEGLSKSNADYTAAELEKLGKEYEKLVLSLPAFSGKPSKKAKQEYIEGLRDLKRRYDSIPKYRIKEMEEIAENHPRLSIAVSKVSSVGNRLIRKAGITESDVTP